MFVWLYVCVVCLCSYIFVWLGAVDSILLRYLFCLCGQNMVCIYVWLKIKYRKNRCIFDDLDFKVVVLRVSFKGT